MRLNQDCVRSVMLFIEDKNEFGSFLDLDNFLSAKELREYKPEEIKYVLAKLSETNYLHDRIEWVNNEIAEYSTGALTWEGHKFLDTIRDNKVWSKTKKITNKFASVSISMVENIASQVITNLITEQMRL
ncbi:MAG: DUF2513 domain-containing protein [Lactobacillus sp.]|nr:DUF2513 domain-containing protein [Lactobacillus sp.]